LQHQAAAIPRLRHDLRLDFINGQLLRHGQNSYRKERLDAIPKKQFGLGR
jgi:hypothetical protein